MAREENWLVVSMWLVGRRLNLKYVHVFGRSGELAPMHVQLAPSAPNNGHACVVDSEKSSKLSCRDYYDRAQDHQLQCSGGE